MAIMPRVSLKGYASLAAGLLWLLMAVGYRFTNVADARFAPNSDGIDTVLESPPLSGAGATSLLISGTAFSFVDRNPLIREPTSAFLPDR